MRTQCVTHGVQSLVRKQNGDYMCEKCFEEQNRDLFSRPDGCAKKCVSHKETCECNKPNLQPINESGIW